MPLVVGTQTHMQASVQGWIGGDTVHFQTAYPGDLEQLPYVDRLYVVGLDRSLIPPMRYLYGEWDDVVDNNLRS